MPARAPPSDGALLLGQLSHLGVTVPGLATRPAKVRGEDSMCVVVVGSGVGKHAKRLICLCNGSQRVGHLGLQQRIGTDE